jgi:hypothetical protein
LASFFAANSNTSLGLTCISLGFLLIDELLDAAARKPLGEPHMTPFHFRDKASILPIEKIDRHDAVFDGAATVRERFAPRHG